MVSEPFLLSARNGTEGIHPITFLNIYQNFWKFWSFSIMLKLANSLKKETSIKAHKKQGSDLSQFKLAKCERLYAIF